METNCVRPGASAKADYINFGTNHPRWILRKVPKAKRRRFTNKRRGGPYWHQANVTARRYDIVWRRTRNKPRFARQTHRNMSETMVLQISQMKQRRNMDSLLSSILNSRSGSDLLSLWTSNCVRSCRCIYPCHGAVYDHYRTVTHHGSLGGRGTFFHYWDCTKDQRKSARLWSHGRLYASCHTCIAISTHGITQDWATHNIGHERRLFTALLMDILWLLYCRVCYVYWSPKNRQSWFNMGNVYSVLQQVQTKNVQIKLSHWQRLFIVHSDWPLACRKKELVKKPSKL